MPSRRQVPAAKRRVARQQRATETVAAILEAATQVLEAGGLAAFNTNAVAERAGVSVGTLYQYFANKNAILVALAEQEMKNGLARIARSLQGDPELGTSIEGRTRAIVRTMTSAFHGRLKARKAVTQAILASNVGNELMSQVAAFINLQSGALAGDALTPEQVFVMSRGLIGAVRAAVMEEQPFLRSRTFEDEVVRLVVSYLQAVPR
jgi:AcrR family transcriptional regulator